jgi:XTP/dITP diphosphohydrolase
MDFTLGGMHMPYIIATPGGFTVTKVVLATRNQGKVRELQAMLAGLDVEVLGLDAFPHIGEIEETGETFEENARIKAKAVSEATGLVAVADDSGLAVDALDGAPGVRSARYSGEDATDEKNNAKLLEAMKDVPDGKRGCKFISCVAAFAPGGMELVFQGVWFGRLEREPKGTGGFGYDPLFFDPELSLTAAEMAPEQKNERSHRGRAVREMIKYFPSFLREAGKDAARTPEQREERAKYYGVKGWLKFMSLATMIGAPLFAARIVVRNLTFLNSLGQPGGPSADVAQALTKWVAMEGALAAGIGVALFLAGLKLNKRASGAVFFAKLSWLAVPVASALQYVALGFMDFPAEHLEKAQTAITSGALPGLAVATLFVTYLTFSRRVKVTYEDC